MADRDAKGRRQAPRGTKNTRAKLTEVAVQEIRSSVDNHRTLAARYGVSRTLISYVRNRKAWKHVR